MREILKDKDKLSIEVNLNVVSIQRSIENLTHALTQHVKDITHELRENKSASNRVHESLVELIELIKGQQKN